MIQLLSLLPVVLFILLKEYTSNDWTFLNLGVSFLVLVITDRWGYDKTCKRRVEKIIQETLRSRQLQLFDLDKRYYSIKVVINCVLKPLTLINIDYQLKFIEIAPMDLNLDNCPKYIKVGKYEVDIKGIRTSKGDYSEKEEIKEPLIRAASPSSELTFFPQQYKEDDEHIFQSHRHSLSILIWSKMQQSIVLQGRWICFVLIMTTNYIVNNIFGSGLYPVEEILSMLSVLVIMIKISRYPYYVLGRNYDILDELKELAVYAVMIYLKHSDKDFDSTIYSSSILIELSMYSIFIRSYYVSKIDMMSIFTLENNDYDDSLQYRYYIAKFIMLSFSMAEVLVIYIKLSDPIVNALSILRHSAILITMMFA